MDAIAVGVPVYLGVVVAPVLDPLAPYRAALRKDIAALPWRVPVVIVVLCVLHALGWP